MKAVEFIEFLRGFEKPVFTTNDAARILGKSSGYTKTYLYRLRKKGWVEEIERGKYALKDAEPLAIASNILIPCYISFLSALKYYGLTTQIPRMIFVATIKSKRDIEKETYAVKFVKLKKQRFFGYSKEKYRGKFIFVGELEKVLVDSLYLPEYCPLSESLNALREGDYDPGRLLTYARRMDSLVLLKRLGYVLDIAGVHAPEVRVSKRYDLLNPSLPKSGEKNKKWRLIINEVLEHA